MCRLGDENTPVGRSAKSTPPDNDAGDKVTRIRSEYQIVIERIEVDSTPPGKVCREGSGLSQGHAVFMKSGWSSSRGGFSSTLMPIAPARATMAGEGEPVTRTFPRLTWIDEAVY
jgi:hypothetical protein